MLQLEDLILMNLCSTINVLQARVLKFLHMQLNSVFYLEIYSIMPSLMMF